MESVELRVSVNREELTKLEADVARLKSTDVKISVDASGMKALDKETLKTLNSITKYVKAVSSAERAEAQLSESQRKTARAQESLAKAAQKESESLGKTASSAKNTSRDMGQVSDSTQKAQKSIDKASDSYNRFAAAISQKVITSAINGLKSALNDALDTMKAVDDQLVTVRKVMQASAEEMAVIEEQAYKTAAAYGAEADAYLESVAAFARAGYKDRSAELAELSTKTQIVGDTTGEIANQMILSVDAAYQYGGAIKDLERVLDGMNEIDNNFATSIEKISEGLGKVAPIAAQAHVGINELSAAIGTVTAVTQRSGTEAATALRALFLNIIGDTKTEVEDGVTWTIGEIKGLQDVIKKYSKEAYDEALEQGTVINPMKAIGGLAQSMKEGVLTEQELVSMVSDIGGKLRTTQLLALIQHWDMYQDMLTSFGDSVGSADREVENALDSWTRKTAIVSDKWAQFVSHLIQTDTIKGGLDLVSGALDLLDTNTGRAAASGLALASAGTAIVAVVKGLKATEAGSAIIGVLGNPYFIGAAAVITAIAAAIGAAKTAYEEMSKPFSTFTEGIKDCNEQLGINEERLNEIKQIPWTQRSPEIIEEYEALVKENAELGKMLAHYEKIKQQKILTALTGEYSVTGQTFGVSGAYDYESVKDDAGAMVLAEQVTSAMSAGIVTVDELMKMIPDLGDNVDDATSKLEELGFTISQIDTVNILSGEQAVSYFTIEINKLREAFLSGKISYDEYAEGLNDIESQTGDLIPALEYLATTEDGVTEGQQKFLDAVDGADGALQRFTPVVRGAGEAVNKFAEPWDSATFSIRQTTEAVKEAQGETDALSAILFDAEGNLSDFAEKALEAAGASKDLAYQEAQANYAAAKANYENIIAQIQAVGSAASLTSAQLQLMAAYMGMGGEEYENAKTIAATTGRSVGEVLQSAAAGKLSAAKRDYAQTIDDILKNGANEEGKGSGGGGGSKSYTRRDTLESELKLLEAQGASEAVQAAKMREIQAALNEEAESLRASGAAEAEINGLSAEWWEYQNKINSLLKDAADLTEDAASATEAQNDALEKQLEIEEKQLAVEEARAALKNAEEQRTVRIYNASTGNWNWVADQRTVESAKEKLADAEKALADAYGNQSGSAESGGRGTSNRGTVIGADFDDTNYNGFKIPTLSDTVKKIEQYDNEIEKAKAQGKFGRAAALSELRAGYFHSIFDNNEQLGTGYTAGLNGELYKDGSLVSASSWDSNYNPFGVHTEILSAKDVQSVRFADEVAALRLQGFNPSSVDLNGVARAYAVYGRRGFDNSGNSRFYDPDQDYTALMRSARNESEFWQYAGLREAKVNDFGGAFLTEGELTAMLDVAKLRWEQEKKQAEVNKTEIEQLKQQYDLLKEQNASLDVQLATLDKINDAYDKQKKYLEGIGAEEKKINALNEERDAFFGKNGSTKTGSSVSYDASVDYSKLMMQATTKAEFDALAAQRSAKAAAEGIDISGTANGGYRSNEELAAQAGFFDAGGVLGGVGGIKATMRDEMVLPPDITERMLAPSADSRFQSRMNELRYIYGDRMQGAGNYSRYDNRIGAQYNGAVVNGQYNFGGISLNESQARSTTVFELAQLARTLRTQSSLT